MIDHAPHYHAQLRAAAEDKAIAELDKHAAPLLWMLLVVLAILAAAALWEGWQDYANLTHANEALVQCLNGHMVGIDGAVVRCQVTYLVGGEHAN